MNQIQDVNCATFRYKLNVFICLCRPVNGGKFCDGSSRSYKLCNTEACPPNTADYRAQQCAEYNSKPFRGWYYTWRPYTRVDGESEPLLFLIYSNNRYEHVLTYSICIIDNSCIFSHTNWLFFPIQIKMFASFTVLLKVMISSLPWPAKLKTEHFVPKTAPTSVLTVCVR